MSEKILNTLRIDLKQAFDTPKCKKCGCLRDTLIALRDETAAVSGEGAKTLREDIATFLDGMELIQYACLGCDPCYPAVAENRFHTAAEGVLTLREVNRPSCSFEVRDDGEWPIVPGEFVVVDRAAPVAVSALASAELPQALDALHPRGLAIVGKTETENIGIDKVVKNLIANECIHTLIVAGQEPKGHLSGQTLLAMAANGVDEKMRVIGSPGRRPFLRNVTREDVQQFREQIKVVDLIGCEDVQRITKEVESMANQAPCGCHRANAARAVAAPAVPTVRATPATRVKLDKTGYFVILPQPDRGIIITEHYDYHDRLLHTIEGEDARTICATLIDRGLISQLDHAAYLGRELMRAELSLRSVLPFVQDGAQGELEAER